MKSVIISIQPYWVFLIIAKAMGWDIQRKKTLEIRKDYPKDKEWNKITHIYCSKNRKSFKRIPKKYQPFMERLLGKVIGKFVCDRITEIPYDDAIKSATFYEDFTYWNDCELDNACMHPDDLDEYANGKDLYGWHISHLVIYNKQKELGEFRMPCRVPKRIPCSGCGWASLYMDHCERPHLTKPPQSYCYAEVSHE